MPVDDEVDDPLVVPLLPLLAPPCPLDDVLENAAPPVPSAPPEEQLTPTATPTSAVPNHTAVFQALE